MAKKKNEISIRSSAAEYLTYVASVGNQADSFGFSRNKRCLINLNLWRILTYENTYYWLQWFLQEILYNNDEWIIEGGILCAL